MLYYRFIDLLGDPAECSVPDEDGRVLFTTREIRIYCGGKEVTDRLGKNIAFYLMRYGEWIERDDHDQAIMQDGKVVGMRFIYDMDRHTANSRHTCTGIAHKTQLSPEYGYEQILSRVARA